MSRKYVYPAIFTPENNGAYSVRFPDINGCYASGASLQEAHEMAQDALCLMLYDLEESQEKIPNPSKIKEMACKGDEFASLVACDTIDYRKYYDSKAVKKTLSIPAWLNTMAERDDVNFSAVLQNALKRELHIEQ